MPKRATNPIYLTNKALGRLTPTNQQRVQLFAEQLLAEQTEEVKTKTAKRSHKKTTDL